MPEPTRPDEGTTAGGPCDDPRHQGPADDGRCGDRNPWLAGEPGRRCQRPRGHDGGHWSLIPGGGSDTWGKVPDGPLADAGTGHADPPADLREALAAAVPHAEWCEVPHRGGTCICGTARRHTADAVLPVVVAEVDRARAELVARRHGTPAALLDQFHRRPGCDVDQPSEPSIDVPGVLDRLIYIEQEVAELREAVEARDLPGALKELADVAYVVYGLAWRCRLPLDAAIVEVHRSNMTKTPSPGDGKAIKGQDYSAADMDAVLGGEQRG